MLKDVGVWRSWLARRVWDAEVGGSSPLTPTKKDLFFRKWGAGVICLKTLRVDLGTI